MLMCCRRALLLCRYLLPRRLITHPHFSRSTSETAAAAETTLFYFFFFLIIVGKLFLDAD